MEIRNYTIRYEDSTAYNAKSKEEAVKLFKCDYPDAEIIEIQE